MAAEIGLEPGDKIISVNGGKAVDIIDLSFYMADEHLELAIEKSRGQKEIIALEKDYDQQLGVEFESAVFDGIRQCANKCIFCFIDQMPRHIPLRQSLYVKDDDYRLSFLNGNFITLTNLNSKDLSRIKRLHLSPLYISVHTTNGALRTKMMNNPKADLLMKNLKNLIEAGIHIHAQVVLCSGVNDGPELEKTIEDLYSLRPEALSLAIVPVGLTRFRDKCYHLNTFTKEQAGQVIAQAEKWQKLSRKTSGESFVYLADEFYLIAEKNLPSAKYYDDFPQLENGVGLSRKFIDELNTGGAPTLKNININQPEDVRPCRIDAVCGTSAEKILKKIFSELKFSNKLIRPVAVENEFFGKTVTVTGLLTGKDILATLNGLPERGGQVVLPGIVLRDGEDVFLDGMTLGEFEKAAKVPVKVVHNASELKKFLTEK